MLPTFQHVQAPALGPPAPAAEENGGLSTHVALLSHPLDLSWRSEIFLEHFSQLAVYDSQPAGADGPRGYIVRIYAIKTSVLINFIFKYIISKSSYSRKSVWAPGDTTRSLRSTRRNVLFLQVPRRPGMFLLRTINLKRANDIESDNEG